MDREELHSNYEGGYCVGMIVWAKVKGYPWWPGRIALIEGDGSVLVNFIGHESHAYLKKSELKMYNGETRMGMKGRGGKKLDRAIKIAKEMYLRGEYLLSGEDVKAKGGRKDKGKEEIYIESRGQRKLSIESENKDFEIAGRVTMKSTKPLKYGGLIEKIRQNKKIQIFKSTRPLKDIPNFVEVVPARRPIPPQTDSTKPPQNPTKTVTPLFSRCKDLKFLTQHSKPLEVKSRLAFRHLEGNLEDLVGSPNTRGITILKPLYISGSKGGHHSTSYHSLSLPQIIRMEVDQKYGKENRCDGYGGLSGMSSAQFPTGAEEIVRIYHSQPIPLTLHKKFKVGKIIQKAYDGLPFGETKSRLAKIIRREKDRLKHIAWKGCVIDYLDSEKRIIDVESEETTLDTPTFKGHVSGAIESIDKAIMSHNMSDTAYSITTPKFGLGAQTPGIMCQSNPALFINLQGSMITKLRAKVIRRIYSKLIEEFKTERNNAKILATTIESAANEIYPDMKDASQYVSTIKNYFARLKVD